MNSQNNKLRELLDDVVPPSAGRRGPERREILEMVRHERSGRTRKRVLCSLAVVLVAGGIVLSKLQPPMSPQKTAPTAPESRIVVNSINDDELMALLQATPAALMELPNGDRTLLVVDEY
jgi:hypothetical protein